MKCTLITKRWLQSGLGFATIILAHSSVLPLPLIAEDDAQKYNDGIVEVPLGLKPLPNVKDNPLTPEKLALGRQLYFDPRLSSDMTVSCASCHDPKKGWSNGDATAVGIDGQRGGRSAPTILNTAYQQFQFWDGRAGSLEEQALGPIENPIEMNLPIEEAVQRIADIEGYQTQFKKVFGEGVTRENLARAIAAYECTILSGNAPYDRFKAGDTTALSEQAQLGMKLFFGKANCSGCHSGPNFTDNGFHNLGVNFHGETPDLGREVISKLAGDRGAFKTPTLRDIARTAPYMHDGSLATLEEVVEHYNRGAVANEFLDEEIFPLKLTDEKKAALVAFMREGLTSDSYPDHEPPTLPE
ncbi:cytochrome-c peroxidase [Aureliella helgolandensis]|uniref:Methylamine utilization protein MauG n=1 Tax=Aureliella helgolandensis TaxID=2527968 RepID=A0A518G4I7_9BACT|nr:cytochrome c peroxidase [Aureliella helgolandensis]QDV23511.1 Cytochrome c551 peroxidase precursor [Aureliella helgolandensis]